MIENIEWDNNEHMSISEIVNASYEGGFKFYRYSALFFNFLNETQPQTITDLHKVVRSDDVVAFDAVVADFANDTQLQTDYSEYLTTKMSEIEDMNDFTPTTFPMPAYLDTDWLDDIQSEIVTVDVFVSSMCKSIATTINARFECSGTVSGATSVELNTKLNTGIAALNDGLNNFTTMNCAIGNVSIDGDTVSAPYSCEGGLRELGTDQILNQAPTANAGDDMTIGLREITKITGTASTDYEGDNLTYSWIQTGGESVGNVDPSGGFDKMTLSFYAYEQHDGTELTFELKVYDGEYSNTDVVVITVGIISDNEAPVADAGTDQIVDEADTVTLNGTATDADNDELTLTWVQTSGTEVTLSDGEFVAPEVDDVTTLTFELTAYDGSLTSTDAVTITVNNTTVTNTAPTANAGIDQTVDEGDTVTLASATSTDFEDDLLTITWAQTAGTTVTITNGKFTAPQVTSTETLTFELTVDDGELTDSDTIIITVNNVVEITTTPPTITNTSKTNSGGSLGFNALFLLTIIALKKCNYFSTKNSLL